MAEHDCARHPQLFVEERADRGWFPFLGLCIILAMFLQNESTRAALFSSPINLIALPAAIIVVAAIIALSIFLAQRNANQLAGAQLQSGQGKVRLDEESSGESGITSYEDVK